MVRILIPIPSAPALTLNSSLAFATENKVMLSYIVIHVLDLSIICSGKF